MPTIRSMMPLLSPVWNDGLGQLSAGSLIILILDKPAPNLRAILNAFQAAGWPGWIANPIEPDPTMDKHARLGSAVYKLNGGKKKIKLLRFHRDGKGAGVIWEWLPTKKKKNR